MGSRTYEKTHQDIIASGKHLFMIHGFERTNLRQLCQEAGVTTGSFYRHFSSKEELFSYLVEPAVQGIYHIYHQSESQCFENMPLENPKEIWKLGDEAIITVIDFIYEHFDCFKLLLESGDGTKYSSFMDDLVAAEVKNSMKMMAVMEENGIKINKISENEFHMFLQAYLTSIFECVMHNYKKEETLKYVHTIVRFFNAGWYEILGIK